MPVNYFDYDIQGKTFSNGNAVIYENDEAIQNAILMWLTSAKGEYLKNPSEGGLLDFFLFKKMTTEKLRLLGFSLYNAFYITFLNVVKVLNIEIAPNAVNRYIEINVTYQIINTNTIVEESIIVDKAPENKSSTYIDVAYVEENLYEFVSIQKNSHSIQKLLFNTVLNSWVWGEFKLINLTEDDSYFASILNLCNVQ